MTEDQMTDEQSLALDALIAAAVDVGLSTNEHAHRASLSRLKESIGGFLDLFDPAPPARTLSQAINASYEGG